MHPVAPRLTLLAAPPDVETALSITAKQLAKVLQLARQKNEVVVLDVHRTMDAVAIEALDTADVLYLVMDNDMPSVRDAKRLVKLFRSLGYADDKLRLLVNRYDSHSFVDLKSIEEAVGLPVVQTLPRQSAAVSESISLGQPLVKTHPQNPAVDALRQVGANFLQTQAPKKQDLVFALGGCSCLMPHQAPYRSLCCDPQHSPSISGTRRCAPAVHPGWGALAQCAV